MGGWCVASLLLLSGQEGRAPAEERIAALEAENATLRRTVAALTARVADLEARLRADSTTSSRPPSWDGLANKPATPRVSGGRRGEQPGTPGAHPARVADPDVVVEREPAVCGGCGVGLDDAVSVLGVVARQVFDVSPVRLAVTEHRAVRRRCGCGRVTAAAFPAAVTAPVRYGPGVRALIGCLGVYQRLPVDRLAQLLCDVLGAPVSTGTVAAVTAQAAAAVAPAVEAIADRLAAAAVVCADETGARVDGALHRGRVAATDTLTHYTVHPRRGCAATDAAGILPRLRGVMVHDGWAAYRGHTGAAHALCNAHHLRELAAVIDADADAVWAAGLVEVLRQANRWVNHARAAQDTRLPDHRHAAIAARCHGRVAQGLAATAGTKTKAAAPAVRLGARAEEVSRFTSDFAVPFDNNQAKRDIRNLNIAQKVSGCWRSLPGAQAFAAVRSYVSTLREHRQPILPGLHAAFDGNPWLPPATAS